VNPVLINRDNMIIAGHGRVEAAKLLGMVEIPTIRLGNLTEDQVRALSPDHGVAQADRLAGGQTPVLASIVE
jgi:ParB-like chromosome segregation protein Spo0J